MTGTGRKASSAIIGVLIAAAPVFAQDVDPPRPRPPLTDRRPIEVAFGVDGVASWLGGGRDVRLSVGVPKGERISFEFFAGAYDSTSTTTSFSDFVGSGDIRGIYGFQIRQQVFRGLKPGLEPFVTYGAMGVFLQETVQCIAYPCTPDRPTRPVVPALGLFGFGVQHAIAPRLALRLEAQGGFFLIFPVGIRASAALAIPLGGSGYRTRKPA